MNKSNSFLAWRQLADEFGAKKPMMEVGKAYGLIGKGEGTWGLVAGSCVAFPGTL